VIYNRLDSIIFLIQITIGYVEQLFLGTNVMLRKTATAALAVGLGLAGLATPVSAATILTFAQNGVAPPTNFDFTDNGDGTTSISTALSIAITALQGPLVPPPITDAIITLNATSTNTATTFVFAGVTFLVQRYTGTFAIDASECGSTGVCLSGTFVDLLSAQVGGRALTISATEPPVGAVTFASDIIPPIDIATDRALALSATNFDTPIAEDCTSGFGCTLATNSSNLAGTFSADTAPGTPEPSTWVMMFLGFAGLGLVGHRSSRMKIALID
jgi:hypothetical protein